MIAATNELIPIRSISADEICPVSMPPGLPVRYADGTISNFGFPYKIVNTRLGIAGTTEVRICAGYLHHGWLGTNATP